jgi:hypothetical protein
LFLQSSHTRAVKWNSRWTWAWYRKILYSVVAGVLTAVT